MLIAWARRTGAEFARAVLATCAALNWPADYASDLMACMAFESGETFSASIRNRAGSGAAGLIQFMPATAEGLGTSIDALVKMTSIEQLVYVQHYFAPYASRVRCLADMYMAILLPRYITAAGNAVLFSGGNAYRQNAGLDENTDGVVTKDEAVNRVRSKLARGWQPENMDHV